MPLPGSFYFSNKFLSKRSIRKNAHLDAHVTTIIVIYPKRKLSWYFIQQPLQDNQFLYSQMVSIFLKPLNSVI